MIDINLNLYKTFYEVAKAESLTKASQAMIITIPAISRNIKTLENQLNEELFLRENTGVKLTRAGKELYTYIEQGLKFIDIGEKSVINNEDLNTAKINIGCPSHVSTYYLMKYIKEIEEDYPNMELNLIGSAYGNKLIDMIEENKIDFAIDSTHLNLDNLDVKVEELESIDNIFVSKKPLKVQDVKELEQIKYILPFEDAVTYKELMECLENHNISIKSKTKMDITELRVSAVKDGLGIGYVMRQAVEKELKNKELYEVEIPIELPKSKINLIYLDGKLSKAHKKIINEYLKK